MAISRIDKFIFEVSGKETIKEAASRRQRPLQIICNVPLKEKHTEMIKMAVDLGVRVFSGEIHLYLHSDYDSLLAELIYEGASFGDPKRIVRMNGSPSYELPSIKIATPEGPGLIADSDGWVAYMGMPSLQKCDWASTIASAFAVSCAFASLVKAELLGKGGASTPWHFNLLNLSEDTEFGKDYELSKDIDIGHIGILGAGAIGSAVGYLLKLSNWRAKIDVIDSQRYEEPNQETSLLITKSDVLASPKKAEFLAAILDDGERLIAKPFVKRVDETCELLKVQRDIFICGVDNIETRTCLDEVNSPLLLNAGLGGSKFDAGHVLYTEHGKIDGHLSENYRGKSKPASDLSSEVPAEFRDQCSRLNYESVSLAAPFLSLASAALLLSGCARRALNITGEVNYLKADLLGYQRSMQKKMRVKESNSISDVTPEL